MPPPATTPTTIIDEVIEDYASVDPSDADNVQLRKKYLRFLQHVYNYIWNVREWEWTYKESALSMLAGASSVALPDDFHSIGHQGSLFDDARRVGLIAKSRWEVERYRKQGNVGGLHLDIFAVWGGLLQIPYVVTSATSFTLFHRFTPEILLDDGSDVILPHRYVETVLKPALVWKVQTKKQDARPTWGEQFQAGLSQMAANENPMVNSPVKMPSASKGSW